MNKVKIDNKGRMIELQNLIKTTNRGHIIKLYTLITEYIILRNKIMRITRAKDIAREIGISPQSLARTLSWKYANDKTKKLVLTNQISMPFVLRILQRCHGKKQDIYIEKVIKNNLNYDTIDVSLSNHIELNTQDEEVISRQYFRGCNKKIETLQKDLLGFNNITDEYKEKLKGKLIRLNRSINIILKC